MDNYDEYKVLKNLKLSSEWIQNSVQVSKADIKKINWTLQGVKKSLLTNHSDA